MVVCLLHAPRPQCSLTRAKDGRIVRCGIISSCQLAASSEIGKALLVTSLSCISKQRYRASTLTFLPFTGTITAARNGISWCHIQDCTVRSATAKELIEYSYFIHCYLSAVSSLASRVRLVCRAVRDGSCCGAPTPLPGGS